MSDKVVVPARTHRPVNGARARIYDSIYRASHPTNQGRLYVWKTRKTDIRNEPENILKTKGRVRDFFRGEAENILKPNHLVRFADDTMSFDKMPHPKGAKTSKSG
jgi:hypothetical protein